MSVHQDERFEERAAIMEYDGGLSRRDAEWRAWTIIYGDRIIREELYEERAAIIEFDGGLPRNEAERTAHVIAYNTDVYGRRQAAVQGVDRPHV